MSQGVFDSIASGLCVHCGSTDGEGLPPTCAACVERAEHTPRPNMAIGDRIFLAHEDGSDAPYVVETIKADGGYCLKRAAA